MKRIGMIIAFIVLLFVGWIGVDRFSNIESHLYHEKSVLLLLDDSVWVNIPDEQWIEIDHKQFRPYHAALNVEGYRSYLHTWENTISSTISYTYNDSGEEPIPLYISEYVKPFEYNNIQKVTYEETMDGIHVIFGNLNNTFQVLQLTKNDKNVNIEFYKGDINKLTPLFESIFEDVKNNF